MLRHTLVLFLLLWSTVLSADKEADRYESGHTLYFKNSCNTCHGSRAEGGGIYPHLANRAKGFLTYRLKRFKAGKADTARQEIMLGFASRLSDDEIDAITTFLSDFHEGPMEERYEMGFDSSGDGDT